MNKVKVFTSMSWRLFERIGAQAAAFIVNIVMARLLSPEDFGVIALAAVFITLLNAVADNGIRSALIQKDVVDDTDCSTGFIFHLAASVFLCAALFVLAPYIALFYGNNELTLIVRVMSLMLILSGIRSVPEARLIRELQLKLFFIATMAGTVISAVIGIWMAFRGYGVWALLTQHLLNSAIDTVIVFLVSGWRPSWDFSVSRLAKLLRFGMGVMAASLADTLYGNLRQLLIGKFHSASSLGFYNKGEQLPNVVTINVNSPLQTALYPVLSVSQHDTVKVRAMLKRSIEVSAYISAPLMAGLAVIASQAVRLLMTDKWLPCVPYVYVFCFVYFLFPIQESFHSAVKALGKSSLYFRTELLKKTIGVLLLVITIRIGSFAVCLSLIPYVLIVQIIDGSLIGSLLDFRISEQLRSILPPVILAVLMSACIIPAAMLGLPPAATTLLQVLSGATVYIAVSALLHFESYLYLKDILMTLLRR